MLFHVAAGGKGCPDRVAYRKLVDFPMSNALDQESCFTIVTGNTDLDEQYCNAMPPLLV